MTLGIIPILGGPIAILLSFLPQALVAVAAAIGTWLGRRRLARLGWRRALLLGGCLSAAGGALWWILSGNGPGATWTPPASTGHIPGDLQVPGPTPHPNPQPPPVQPHVAQPPVTQPPIEQPPPPGPAAHPPLGTPGPWPTFRGGTERLGAVSPASFRAGIQRAWSFQETIRRGVFAGCPAYADGRVYASCENNRLYCFDGATGEVLWSLPTSQPVFSSPAVSHGRVFVGEGLHYDVGSCLHCVDAATGRLLWKFPTRGHIESSPTVADDRIFFGAGPDGVWAITLEGEIAWHLATPHCDSAPLATAGKLFFGSGYEDCAVYVVDAASGRVLQRHPLPWSSWGPPALCGDRVLYGAGHRLFARDAPPAPGRVLCVSVADGGLLWQREMPDVVMTTFATRGALACFGCSDGTVRMIDTSDGHDVWTAHTGGAVFSSPAWGLDAILVGTSRGRILALDPETGATLWEESVAGALQVSGNGILSSPIVVGNRLFLGGASLDFVAYDAR